MDAMHSHVYWSNIGRELEERSILIGEELFNHTWVVAILLGLQCSYGFLVKHTWNFCTKFVATIDKLSVKTLSHLMEVT